MLGSCWMEALGASSSSEEAGGEMRCRLRTTAVRLVSECHLRLLILHVSPGLVPLFPLNAATPDLLDKTGGNNQQGDRYKAEGNPSQGQQQQQ